MASVRPIDAQAIIAAAKDTGAILTCEEHTIFGIATKAYNLLGQPISIATKGQLIIIEDQFGNRKKTIQLD